MTSNKRKGSDDLIENLPKHQKQSNDDVKSESSIFTNFIKMT